LDSANG